MTRNNISDKLRKYERQLTEYKKTLKDANSRIEILEQQPKVHDWFDKHMDATSKRDRILKLRPSSSDYDTMYKLAKFLYEETVKRTSECMMTFELKEVDEFLNLLIDFDDYTTNYVLQLVHQIGGINVTQTDYYNEIFDITVGLEVVALYHLKIGKKDYIEKIINYLEKEYNYSREENLFVGWVDLNNIMEELEMYSMDEEDPTQEQIEAYFASWMESDFTAKLKMYLDNSYAFTQIEEDGLLISLSEYYA